MYSVSCAKHRVQFYTIFLILYIYILYSIFSSISLSFNRYLNFLVFKKEIKNRVKKISLLNPVLTMLKTQSKRTKKEAFYLPNKAKTHP